MNYRTSYHLLFFIKRKKILKSGKASIFVKITFNKTHTEFVLNCTIDPELWSKEKGGAKGNSKEAKLVNEFINSARFKFQICINKLNSNGIDITVENLKIEYLGIKPKVKMVLEIFDDHNQKMKSLIGVEFAQVTYNKYIATYKHLSKFIKFKFRQNDIEITKVNHEFIADLDYYLRSERSCGHNTIMKYLGNFKKIVRIAVHNDWLKKYPFSNYKLSWKKTERGYLSESELQKIENKEFSIARIQIVKDCFLFACYTGLAHSDLQALTSDNIILGSDNKPWVSIKRKKTEVRSNIPLLPIAAAIIEKYKDYPPSVVKGVLLPVLSNQKMNAYLKEIADICGITKTLTSHVARHTFATTITLNNDVPIESVSKMLGHSSLEMTKIYAKILDKKVGRDMEAVAKKYSG